MSMRINWLVLFMCVPLIAQAQAYRCKQPNGALSFQDHPCLAGSASSKITLPPVTSEPAEPANQFRTPKAATQKAISPQEAWQAKERDQRQRAEEETRAQNQKTNAYNQMQRCDFARRQLGVLKESRPAYRHDNNGDRQYIKDENRQAETATAQKNVAEECR